MAPRTRSVAAKSGNATRFTAEIGLPRNFTFTRDSTSSAPTLSTSPSDGDDSTPATSATQTPATDTNSPSRGKRTKFPRKTKTKGGPTSSTPTVSGSSGEILITTTSHYDQASAPTTKSNSQLVVEIPQIPSAASKGNDKMPGRPNSSRPSRTTSRRANPFRVPDSDWEDEDDDDYFPGDNSRSAALARKLIREDEHIRTMVSSSNASHVQPAKGAVARGQKRPRAALSSDLSDDENSNEWDVNYSSEDSGYGVGGSRNIVSDYTDDSPLSESDQELLRNPKPQNHKRQKTDGSPDGDCVYQSEKWKRPRVPWHDGLRSASEDVLARYIPPELHRPDNYAKYKRRLLELRHPTLETMWSDLEKMPAIDTTAVTQPANIKRTLKPFQLAGLAWMKAMEAQKWKGGVLGDEMGLGKTIQAVSLIMSDYPTKMPSLVLVPPAALMQWVQEINSYTSGQLKTLMYHGTNTKAKKMTLRELKKLDVIIISYNSLEAMHRKQEKGVIKGEGVYKEKSVLHQIKFHRVILDEAHFIKSRASGTAKACFALQATYRWCLTGTPLQNRIGEYFSLLRFLNMTPYAAYVCKSCPCECFDWAPDEKECCTECSHTMLMHVSIFNTEILTPIKNEQSDAGKALEKLKLLTSRLMLRRLKKDHMDDMDLPVKELRVVRQFYSERETDFANSIRNKSKRQFDDYVASDVLLKNYANIFGLIMRMRQAADHPDLILKKDSEGGQNVLVCCICDEPAEEAIRSKCKHDFCRSCAKNYVDSQEAPDCPQCHIPLSIDLEQPEMEQDSELIKKSSIINRIKMENWKSSTKIEMLVHEIYRLRSDKMCQKSIIFSQFTSMLQLVQWRLQRAGVSTVMLDGSMNPAQRNASIEHFMKNVNVECFLVSLKAGGVALNLTEASRVFIVDPWWNPATEWQSADRCHRIGQTRPCVITRLCIEDSVESRMVALQEKKANMINSAVDAEEGFTMESLSSQDLHFLFRMD